MKTIIRNQIKNTLEQLDPLELALILSWMKDNGYLTPVDVMPTEERAGNFVYLKTKIRDNLNNLDTKQLAKLFSWMKSGEMYNYGAAIIGNQSTAEIVRNALQKED